MARITIAEPASFAGSAADRITAFITRAIATRGTALVSLTGGTTPRQAYEALADPERPFRTQIDWSRVHLFWGDERHVPPDHPDSNFGMADLALIVHVPIPAAQVHRIQGEIPDPREAARAYGRELTAAFAAAGRDDLAFDLMLLGLGEDCHIASIFPGSDLLGPGLAREVDSGTVRNSRRRQDLPAAAAVWAPRLETWRITLTPEVILDSRAILMLVAGEAKAAAVAAALVAPRDVVQYPAQLLRQADERVEWLLDPDAARLLG